MLSTCGRAVVRSRRRWFTYVPMAVVVVSLVSCGTVDPAPPEFEVGFSKRADGTITLHALDCRGGSLEHLQVAADTGVAAPNRTALWEVAAADDGGLPLARGEVYEVTVGVAPHGMTEAVKLDGPLPSTKLVAEFRTSRQGYGFFFEPDSAEPGMIWSRRGGNQSPTRFARSADCPD